VSSLSLIVLFGAKAFCNVKIILLACSSMWKDTHHTKFVSDPLDVVISSYKTPVLGITSVFMVLFRLVLSVL